VDAIGWYKGNSGGTTHPVGTKMANAFGLYDMTAERAVVQIDHLRIETEVSRELTRIGHAHG
jgi:hypothetical protein